MFADWQPRGLACETDKRDVSLTRREGLTTFVAPEFRYLLEPGRILEIAACRGTIVRRTTGRVFATVSFGSERRGLSPAFRTFLRFYLF
jgi:hypothetical protein